MQDTQLDNTKTDKSTEGIGFVACLYCVVMGALFVGGGILTLLEKRKGRSR